MTNLKRGVESVDVKQDGDAWTVGVGHESFRTPTKFRRFSTEAEAAEFAASFYKKAA